MTDRNTKADSSGDLHEIKVLQAEIERLREEHRAYQELAKELKARDEAEIERLRGSIADTNVVIEQVSAEIERLKKGLDACAVSNEQYEQANNALSAEIERLRELVDAEQGLAKGIKERNAYLEQEVKRLRAELRLRKDEYVERQEWAAEQAMAVIKEKDAEIERLRHEIDVQCSSEYVERILKENERLRGDVRQWQQNCANANAEIERLRRLTENDAKEIGSYREGTGLRGENRRLRAALERIAGSSYCTPQAEYLKQIAREALKDG